MNFIPSTPKSYYRLGVGLAIATSLFLVWVSAGVGIIGSDGDPANLMYGAVLAVAVIGAVLTRLRPLGTAGAMVAAALAQALITSIALVRGLGQPYSPPLELIGLNGGFITLWLGSAWLFRRAARKESTRAAA